MSRPEYCAPLLDDIVDIMVWRGAGQAAKHIAPFREELAALAAGSLTGLDYCFDIVLEKYYEVKDRLEENPLYVPREKPSYSFFVEAVEASIEFEERLADSRTVLFAEPILAASLKAYCLRHVISKIEPKGIGLFPSRLVIVENSESGREKITVPFPLYLLAVRSLSLLYTPPGFRPGIVAEGAIIAPDPARVRDKLYYTRIPVARIGHGARKIIDAECDRIKRLRSAEDACNAEGVIVIGYQLSGFYWKTWYICG